MKPKEDEGAEAQRQADVLDRIFEDLDFVALCKEFLDSHYYGFSAPINFTEESWQAASIDGRTYQVPVTYEQLPRQWIYAKKESKADDYTTLFVGDAPFHSYPDGSVVLMTSHKLPTRQDIDFTSFGVGLGCIRLATFKYYDYEDWAAMNEIFANPFILGKVGPGGREEVVKKAVMEMGNDARGVVGENDEITFPQANSSMSAEAYDRFLDRLNKAIANKIKSESLTDNMGDSGSYAAMRTTNGIRLDVASDMARALLRLVKRKIIQPITDLNWGGRLLVNLYLPVQAVEDKLGQARVFTEAGKLVALSKKQVRTELNLAEPEDEDDAIRPRRGLGFGGV